MGEVAGDSFKVYSTLKMGVLGYQAFQRAQARGASTEEAVRSGAVAALGWMTFVIGTLWQVWIIVWLGITPLRHYAVPQDTGQQTITDISPTHLWLVYAVVGPLTLAVIAALWLTIYSRLKNTINSPKRGLLYQAGFHLDRRIFLLWPTWLLGLVMFFAFVPFSILINI